MDLHTVNWTLNTVVCMQESTHTDCAVINTHGYWTLSCFPPRNVCPLMRTEWTPPLLSGYHSDGTSGWEFGFEFSRRRTNQRGKNTGSEGRVTGKRLCCDFERLHVGLEGKKKNVSRNGLKWITEREREKNVFLFELRQWPWVTAAGLNVQFCDAL